MKVNNIHDYSRSTDKGPSIADRGIRETKRFLKKPVFENGNADWLSELSSVMKKYNNTVHGSTKMNPVHTFLEENGETSIAVSKIKNINRKHQFQLGQLVGKAVIKKIFSRSD